MNDKMDKDDIKKFLVLPLVAHECETEELQEMIYSTALEALGIVDQDKLVEFEEEVFGLLQCEKDYLRAEAIATLCYRTRLLLEKYVDVAYAVWIKDPSELVRFNALAAWASFHAESKDKDVLTKLYKILIDDSYSIEIRAKAHSALFATISLHHPAYDRLNEYTRLFNSSSTAEFNNSLNWTAVNQIMKEYAPEALQ